MNARTLRTIAIKDLKEVAENKGAIIPAVVVPMLFMILLPLGISLLPTLMDNFIQSLSTPGQDFWQYLERFTPSLGNALEGLNQAQTWIVITTGYLLAPFLLMMPLMLSTIVGAESFVGERERKTLEALIYTPASDAELFVGKVIASVLPAVALSWVCFLIYGVTVNIASWPVMGRVWFPPANWWPLMLWFTPATATFGMAVSVLISSKARTFMEAYQISGSTVVLVLALILGQASGVLVLNAGMVMLLGLVVWAIDAVMIRAGVRSFSRANLLARL
ncbi:MAG TPA: ABC transporter permease subunit [Anaerolineaceae bacterium]|nr:ABC transporter permease subunit [Anaerolineaceae bacterium]